jgi:two-component system, chemotaxis family, protein-glutamate methylesterase/glutaminase
MTGMGDDGAEGLGALKKEGAMTIAQSEDSCVVYGMPKAAIERGYAVRVVALDVMSATCRPFAVEMMLVIRSEAGNPGKAMKAGS